MISSAFKSAAQNEAAQQTQFASNISSGIKDVATTVAAIAGLKMPDQSLFKNASQAVFANQIGGVGGNIMLASLQERKEAIKAAKKQQELLEKKRKQDQDIMAKGIALTAGLVANTLSQNPINRSGLKATMTVFEKLAGAYNAGVVDKQGNIETSMGKVNINTPLGQKILEAGDWDNDNDRKGS